MKIITPKHVKRSTLLILFIKCKFKQYANWGKAFSGAARDLHALDYERRKVLVLLKFDLKDSEFGSP